MGNRQPRREGSGWAGEALVSGSLGSDEGRDNFKYNQIFSYSVWPSHDEPSLEIEKWRLIPNYSNS